MVKPGQSIVWGIRSGATAFFEQDEIRSVTSISSPNGTLSGTYTYDSFGNLIASAGTLANPFQYTGREFDRENGLRYYRARYYDPAIGRFTSEDPLGFAGDDGNFYAYVGNSPLEMIDSYGLQSTAPLGLLNALPQGPAAQKRPCPFALPIPPSDCIGKARVLTGNPRLIGKTGGTGGPVTPNSAAAIPWQFGLTSGRGFNGVDISGTLGYSDPSPLVQSLLQQKCSGISDVIGSSDVNNVRDVLMRRFPNTLILELVSGHESGVVPVEIKVPYWMKCPKGTHLKNMR